MYLAQISPDTLKSATMPYFWQKLYFISNWRCSPDFPKSLKGWWPLKSSLSLLPTQQKGIWKSCRTTGLLRRERQSRDRQKQKTESTDNSYVCVSCCLRTSIIIRESRKTMSSLSPRSPAPHFSKGSDVSPIPHVRKEILCGGATNEGLSVLSHLVTKMRPQNRQGSICSKCGVSWRIVTNWSHPQFVVLQFVMPPRAWSLFLDPSCGPDTRSSLMLFCYCSKDMETNISNTKTGSFYMLNLPTS